jgi:hypothetical protein
MRLDSTVLGGCRVVAAIVKQAENIGELTASAP